MSENISMPLISLTTPRVLQACKEYLYPEDGLPTVFVSSFPKSGTTWMQWIMFVLLQVHQKKEIEISHISDFTPFYEIEKTWEFSQASEEGISRGKISSKVLRNQQEVLKYHVFNTHLPFQWLPKDPERIKYIYVMRNGKDAAVSFFHHLTNQVDDDQYQENNFPKFFDDLLAGKLPYGKWIDHLYYWLSSHQRIDQEISQSISSFSANPILILQYEKLVSQLPLEMMKIVNFLHLDINSMELEEKVLPFLSFSYMKTHSDKFSPVSVPWKKDFQFIRKGEVGDSKNVFTEEENVKFADYIQDNLQRIFKEEEEEAKRKQRFNPEVNSNRESSSNDQVPECFHPYFEVIFK
jgi:hypothetical protein